MLTYTAFLRLVEPSGEGREALVRRVRSALPGVAVSLPFDEHARKAWDVSVIAQDPDADVIRGVASVLEAFVARSAEVAVFKAWTFGPG